MEVIKANKWRMELECPTCKSALAILAGDVRYWSNQRTDSCGYDYKCPECEDWPDLAEDNLPNVVKEQAVKRYREKQST